MIVDRNNKAPTICLYQLLVSPSYDRNQSAADHDGSTAARAA